MIPIMANFMKEKYTIHLYLEYVCPEAHSIALNTSNTPFQMAVSTVFLILLRIEIFTLVYSLLEVLF
jgi:hypothetical protein